MSISGPGKSFAIAVAQPVNKQWALKIISCLLSQDSCWGDRERRRGGASSFLRH